MTTTTMIWLGTGLLISLMLTWGMWPFVLSWCERANPPLPYVPPSMDDPLVIARAEASTAAHQRDFFRKRLDDERTKAGALEVRTRYLEAQNEAIWEANLRLRQELARLRSRRRRQVVDVETDDDEGEGGAPPAGPRRP